MELFRFIFTTIFIANASTSPFAQASIIVNYRMAASRLIRKNSSEGGGSTNHKNNNNNSGKTWRGESSSINLWNVRSYSAIQVPTACASMKIIPSNLPAADGQMG